MERAIAPREDPDNPANGELLGGLRDGSRIAEYCTDSLLHTAILIKMLKRSWLDRWALQMMLLYSV